MEFSNSSYKRNFSKEFQPNASEHLDLLDNHNNHLGKINNQSQDSSDSLIFRNGTKESFDPMNRNNQHQDNSSSENTSKQGSTNISKTNLKILSDMIRSCLRKDGKVFQFFEKSIYPKILQFPYKDNQIAWGAVVTEFTRATIGEFFGKMSGNPIQKESTSGDVFVSKKEFLIARTIPEEIRNDCLAIARTLMDFSFGEQIIDSQGVNREYLTRLAKQFFWGSRKFLQDQAIEQIPEFAEHLRSGVKSFNFDKIELEFCDNFKATVELKGRGVEFGEILSLKNGNELITRYFIKGFTGYVVKNHAEGSEDIWGSDGIIDSEDYYLPRNYAYPNIREPLVYKILESFGMGPHVEFIINPYISRGFYIATQDLTHDNQVFMELGKAIFNIRSYDFDKFLRTFISCIASKDIHISVMILDIIIRILDITDIHKGNLGFVIKGCNKFDYREFIKTRPKIVPHIVDFRAHRTSKMDLEDLVFLYMTGVTDLHGKGDSILETILWLRPKEEKFYMGFKAIKGIQESLENLVHIENSQNTKDSDEIRLKILLKEKADEIKSMLLKRRDDLPVLRNRTNAELIGFEFKNSQNESSKEKENVIFIEDAFENLDQYCEEIILNYKTLKNHIINGYHEYYDEAGNLKISSDQQPLNS